VTAYQLKCALARWQVDGGPEVIRWPFKREARAYAEGLNDGGVAAVVTDRLTGRVVTTFDGEVAT
jgi:hypothetical protein